MPDPAAIGTGAGAGGGLLALAWLADRFWGNKPKIPESLTSAIEAIAGQVNKLYEWHAVSDPDDSTQRIWWISKELRQTIRGTQDLLGELASLTEAINSNLERLVDVTSQLRHDVAALKRSLADGD